VGESTSDGEPLEAATPEASLPRDRRVTLGLIALLIVALGYLVYFSRFEFTFAGIGALLAVPAAIGGLTSQLFDPDGEHPPMGCFVWPTLALVGLVAMAFVVFDEGAICIAMVLPVWLPAALAGALVNRWNARRLARWSRSPERFYSAAWLVLASLLVLADEASPPPWETRKVTRSITIAASPEDIWPLLVAIPAIGGDEGRATITHDLLAVPRPSDARLVVRDGRLVRQARWGADIRFEERIVEWRPNRRIAWRFAFTDSLVQDHTDRHISPAGPILRIEDGGYELVPLSSGVTQVRLTTRYRMRSRLSGYLGWWGERLLGDIEANVLAIVKARAEAR